MKDRLCLIPYSEIEFDKTYTNISEYFLRGNRSVSLFLSSNGADEGVALGNCSDFELLSAFMSISNDKGTRESAIERTFERVVKELLGENSVAMMDAEKLWSETADALMHKKLRGIISSKRIEGIGVPLLPGEYFDAHFVAIKGVEITPVFCPLGTKSVSIDTFGKGIALGGIKNSIKSHTFESSACAVFLSGFGFEKPNEYSASKACEKYCSGQVLLNKERQMLATQLLRITALEAVEADKELMVFLPYAPDVASMGSAAELLEYIDEILVNKNLKITVFGGDAVSICMAEAITAKKYKNITAVTGLCGNGSDMPDLQTAKYWGGGKEAIKNRASLASTPALLPC